MSKIGRRQLAKIVSERAEVSVAAAHRVITEAFLVITEELAKGNRVTMTGFGSWRTKVFKPRMGNNPRDGKPMEIPPRTRIAFRAGSHLREATESSIETAIFFGDGIGPSTEVKAILSKLFEPDLRTLDPDEVVEHLRSVLGPIGEKEGEEFFRMLYADEVPASSDIDESEPGPKAKA